MKHRAWHKPSDTPQIHRTKCLCHVTKARLTIPSKLPPIYETISLGQHTKLEPWEVTSFYFLTNANSLDRFLHSSLLEFLSSEPNRRYSDTTGFLHVFGLRVSISGVPTKCRVSASLLLQCFSTCKIQILSLTYLKEPVPPTVFSFVLFISDTGA